MSLPFNDLASLEAEVSAALFVHPSLLVRTLSEPTQGLLLEEMEKS